MGCLYYRRIRGPFFYLLKQYNPDSLKHDKDFLFNRIKSEIAGTLWGKDESASIRLDQDNQVSEALKYFNEADAFLR